MARASKTKLDLRRITNVKCQQCNNREERKEFAEEDLCKILSVQDGLAVRCVGEWAEHKIYRLIQYFGIFARGMRNRWEGLNYVEICSGPGRCVVRNTSEEIDGTALAILNHPSRDFLSKALFIDLDEKVVNALNTRIAQLGLQDKARAVIGDYKNPEATANLLETLPPNALNLVFIDPTQCDVPFETVQKILSVTQNVDLIVNVSIGTDISRNLRQAVLDPAFQGVRGKYENFLGDADFFLRSDVKEAAQQNDIERLRRMFFGAYSAKLEELGFKHHDAREVLHYYYLLFASRHAKGLEFWQKACKYSPEGQKEFGF
jgi:three-Cys-motif partner protein